MSCAARRAYRTALRRGDVGCVFRDLGLPQPDVYLNVGSGSHAAQTAAVMQRFEPVVIEENRIGSWLSET
jgi:UDP-N-acetylglucosamine 2-epimerase